MITASQAVIHKVPTLKYSFPSEKFLERFPITESNTLHVKKTLYIQDSVMNIATAHFAETLVSSENKSSATMSSNVTISSRSGTNLHT